MSLKVRLTAMMVALLVVVVALQFLMMERERRELQQKLSQLSGDVDRSTAIFVQRSHSMSAGSGGRPAIEDLLQRIATDSLSWMENGLPRKVQVLVFTDTSRARFTSAEGHCSSFTEEVVVCDSAGARTMHRRIVQSPPGSFAANPASDPRGPRAHLRLDSLVRVVSGTRVATTGDAHDFVVNLPLPAPAGDSLFALQMRYSYAGLDEALARSRRRGLIWLAAILGGGVLAAAGLAMQFTRPIQALRGSFRRVEGGDLGVRAPVGRHDEIGALTTSFNDMVDRLQASKHMEARLADAERLAAVGRLAAGVAHEVRNPLNTILLTMQHLRDKVTPADAAPSDFDRHYDVVTGEIARLEKLVGSFLDLARSVEIRRERLDVARSIQDAVDLYASQAQDRGVTLAADIVPSLMLDADPSRLPMVWSNLIANALEATPRGGTVRVTARRDAGVVEVVVADTGLGVPAGQRERIWEPFVSGRADGTGLGLAVVRTVVEGHDGHVTAEFPIEGGARMVVRLQSASEA